jgi:hypothetical protein
MNAEYVAVAKLQADVFVTNKKPQITGVFVSAPGGVWFHDLVNGCRASL